MQIPKVRVSLDMPIFILVGRQNHRKCFISTASNLARSRLDLGTNINQETIFYARMHVNRDRQASDMTSEAK